MTSKRDANIAAEEAARRSLSPYKESLESETHTNLSSKGHTTGTKGTWQPLGHVAARSDHRLPQANVQRYHVDPAGKAQHPLPRRTTDEPPLRAQTMANQAHHPLPRRTTEEPPLRAQAMANQTHVPVVTHGTPHEGSQPASKHVAELYGSTPKQVFEAPGDSGPLEVATTSAGSRDVPSINPFQTHTQVHEDAFTRDDLFFMVMGTTGAGKSTFISLVSDDKPEIGHDLQSKTKEVTRHRFYMRDGRRAWLFDTPGFDDTQRSNIEILSEIVAALANMHKEQMRVTGLIYLHRITDPRMSGSAQRNLQAFKLLTGNNAMPLVRLVTTRWNEISPMAADYEKAERSQHQLMSAEKFWAPLLQSGAQVMRHTGDQASAISILESFMKSPARDTPLAVQVELVNRGLALSETAVGTFIGGEDAKLLEKYERDIEALQDERKEALTEKDHVLAEELAKQEREFHERKDELLQAQTDFRGDLSQLNARMYESMLLMQDEEAREALEKKDRDRRMQVARLRDEMAFQSHQQRQASQRRLDSIVRDYEIQRARDKEALRRERRKRMKAEARNPHRVLEWFGLS